MHKQLLMCVAGVPCDNSCASGEEQECVIQGGLDDGQPGQL